MNQNIHATQNWVGNNFTNALKGFASGNPITLADISPIEHNIKVFSTKKNIVITRTGKNMLGFSSDFKLSSGGLTVEYDKETQIFTLNGIPTTKPLTISLGSYLANTPELVIGDSYALSLEYVSGTCNVGTNNVFFLGDANAVDGTLANWTNVGFATIGKKNRIAVAKDKYLRSAWIYIGDNAGASYVNYKFRVQLEKGKVVTKYESYFDPVNYNFTEDYIQIPSLPTTILKTENNITLSVEYNKDINYDIQKIDKEINNLSIYNETDGKSINIKDSAKTELRGLHIYGKTTQADTPTVENPQELVSVGSGGSIRADVYSGNLIPFPYEKTEHESNGVTFIVNDDGSINVNGTATGADAYFNLATAKLFKGTYCISGCPSGGSLTTYYLHLRGYDYDTGKGALFTVKTSWSNQYQIVIKSGYTAKNLVFRPQLNVGTSALPYSKGSAVQTATFNTPNGLPGLPVASDGNYTDENGQQWVCDEIDLSRGKYVQRISELISTGEALKGNVFFTASTNTIYWNYALPKSAVKFAAISTHFKNTPIWREVETLPYMLHIVATHLYLSANANDIGIVGTETMDEMKSLVSAWFAKTFSTGNTLIIYYALETPIETDLTEEEIAQYKALIMHKPVTNIFNDANAHMSVEYVADPKTYIDNKIDNKFAELQNAILSLGGNI